MPNAPPNPLPDGPIGEGNISVQLGASDEHLSEITAPNPLRAQSDSLECEGRKAVSPPVACLTWGEHLESSIEIYLIQRSNKSSCCFQQPSFTPFQQVHGRPEGHDGPASQKSSVRLACQTSCLSLETSHVLGGGELFVCRNPWEGFGSH